jgi:hypothetical protein
MRRREKDRRRTLDPGQMRAGCAEGRGPALQKRLDERDASARSLAFDFDNPTFFVPLWPAPMPSTARPFET